MDLRERYCAGRSELIEEAGRTFPDDEPVRKALAKMLWSPAYADS